MRSTTAPPPSPPDPTSAKEPETIKLVLAVFAAAGYALSARAILLLAVLGSFVLAVMAMKAQTMATLYVMVGFALLVVLPAVLLEMRKRS